MEAIKLGREGKAELRSKISEYLRDLGEENAGERMGKMIALIIPDPTAPPGRTGLRVGKDRCAEVASSISRSLRSKEKLDRVVESLWVSGHEEARLTAALAMGKLIRATEEMAEKVSIDRIHRYLTSTESPSIRHALAETVSHEVEAGLGHYWMAVAKTWAGESDVRLRAFGPQMYSTMFSRGQAPEKLFDALMVMKRVIGDPSDEVRSSVSALAAAGGKKQGPAVRRFLERFGDDEREEVRAFALSLAEKLPSRLDPEIPGM